MKNQHWKIAFFSLLAINIIIVFTICYFIFILGTSTIHKEPSNGDKVNFKINTDKNNLSQFHNCSF
ncbi:DUF2140 family protein [Heyndrickxia sporothermodurans]|uniref:DUF2140 family protein n=1 Tax=Heyndrickxia sporothermodurans TaxID=46224 RepID=UPI00192A8C68|nr:DUF2140 family protein [Heyndrickxia sporothermodurans]